MDNNNLQYVCHWSMAGFDNDEDGIEYNTSKSHDFTLHASLEEALGMAESNDSGKLYALRKGLIQSLDDDWFEPVCCDQILVYDNCQLTGKWSDTYEYHNRWRWYERQEHWDNYWPNLMTLPVFE